MTPVYRDVTWVLTQTKTRMSASVGRVVGAHDPLLRRSQVELFLFYGGLDLVEAGTAQTMTWMWLDGAARAHHHPLPLPRQHLLQCLLLWPFPPLHHRSCS